MVSSRLNLITVSLCLFFALATPTATKAEVVLSGASTATANISAASAGCIGGAYQQSENNTAAPYNLKVGNLAPPSCGIASLDGANFATADGIPSFGLLAVRSAGTLTSSGLGASATASATNRFTITNSSALAEVVSVTSIIDAGAVGVSLAPQQFNTSVSAGSVRDLSSFVTYALRLNGNTLLADSAIANRVINSNGFSLATINYESFGSGIFGLGTGAVTETSLDSTGKWYGTSWNAFTITTSLGVFAPGESKTFEVQVDARSFINQRVPLTQINRAFQQYDTFAFLGDPLSFSNQSNFTFSSVPSDAGGGGGGPGTPVPVMPTVLLIAVGLLGMTRREK
jgi:hypothetical protein